jgi:hypothetical protein
LVVVGADDEFADGCLVVLYCDVHGLVFVFRLGFVGVCVAWPEAKESIAQPTSGLTDEAADGSSPDRGK